MSIVDLQWGRGRLDGGTARILEVEPVDIRGLEPSRRLAIVAAFGTVCRTLLLPLQIVVQVRRFADPAMGHSKASHPSITGGVAEDLSAALAGHWRDRLAERAVYRRRVLFVVGVHSRDGAVDERDGALVERAVAAIRDPLYAAGLTVTELPGDDHGIGGDADDAANHDPDDEAYPDQDDRAVEHARHANVAGVWMRGVRLRRLPGGAVKPGWLAPLLTVAAECDIAIHLAPVTALGAATVLRRHLRAHGADRLLRAERGALPDPSVDLGYESALDLRERLAGNLAVPLRMQLVATGRGGTAAAAQQASDRIRDALAAMTVQSDPTHLEHLAAARSTAPRGVNCIGEGKLIDSEAAASCVPWLESACQEPDGYVLGSQQGSGLPVAVAPFDTTLHSNANILILAASGQGKSYSVGTILLEAARHGAGAMIIDPEGEYEPLVNALGGHYLRLRSGGTNALNVFDLDHGRGDRRNTLDDGVGGGGDVSNDAGNDVATAVTDLVAVMCAGLSPLKRAEAHRAALQTCHAAKAENRVAVLGDIIGRLQPGCEVAAILRRYCGEGPGAVFNRPTSIPLGAATVGISLRDLDDEYVPAATYLLGQWLWHGLVSSRRPRHLVFDEAGLMSTHRPIRALLVQLARRCRKYGASLIVATQNAQDLLATDEGAVVATNCSVVLLGGHRALETMRMHTTFGLTDSQRLFVETAGRGEFLLLSGNRRLAMKVDVPPLYHDIITDRRMLRGGAF